MVVTRPTAGRRRRRIGCVRPGDEVAALEVDLGRHHLTGHGVPSLADRLEGDDRSMRAVVVRVEDRAPDLERIVARGPFGAIDLLIPGRPVRPTDRVRTLDEEYDAVGPVRDEAGSSKEHTRRGVPAGARFERRIAVKDELD